MQQNGEVLWHEKENRLADLDCAFTNWRKSSEVTKSANQSNFSRIKRSMRSSSLVVQLALQSMTNSGVIGMVSSSSLHLAAMYKQPTARHSRYFGRTCRWRWQERERERQWTNRPSELPRSDRECPHSGRKSHCRNASMRRPCGAMWRRDSVANCSLHPRRTTIFTIFFVVVVHSLVSFGWKRVLSRCDLLWRTDVRERRWTCLEFVQLFEELR